MLFLPGPGGEMTPVDGQGVIFSWSNPCCRVPLLSADKQFAPYQDETASPWEWFLPVHLNSEAISD